MRASLVVETGEARDTHQIACLFGFGATAVVGVAIGHAIDRRTDLLLREAVLKTADRDRRRPVVKSIGVTLLDGNPREVIDQRVDAGDRRLL